MKTILRQNQQFSASQDRVEGGEELYFLLLLNNRVTVCISPLTFICFPKYYRKDGCFELL